VAETFSYTAAIYSDDEVDQGPIDLTGAKDDTQARELARAQGKVWLNASVFDHATVRISRNGYALAPVKISR
jgi:hypothetical protein